MRKKRGTFTLPSYVGEASAVVAVLNFIVWAASHTPRILLWLWLLFALVFLVDWMLGGIADRGICQRCVG